MARAYSTVVVLVFLWPNKIVVSFDWVSEVVGYITSVLAPSITLIALLNEMVGIFFNLFSNTDI